MDDSTVEAARVKLRAALDAETPCWCLAARRGRKPDPSCPNCVVTYMDGDADLARAALSAVEADMAVLAEVRTIAAEWDDRGATWCMVRIAALLEDA